MCSCVGLTLAALANTDTVECSQKVRDYCRREGGDDYHRAKDVEADDMSNQSYGDDASTNCSPTSQSKGPTFPLSKSSGNGAARSKESANEPVETRGNVSACSPTSINERQKQMPNNWERGDKEDVSTLIIEENSNEDASCNSDNCGSKESHEQRRQIAQKKLLKHANKAMTLFGGRALGEDPPVAAQKAMYLIPIEPSMNDTVSEEPSAPSVAATTTVISVKQSLSHPREFPAVLKNDGIEVLKLGRRKKWQVRYLTVSREMMWINARDTTGDIGQCPKALLWLKRFDNRLHGISSLRSNGRGGLLFSNLLSMRTIDKESELPIPIPKRMVKKFPGLAGVTLDYTFDKGNRRSLLLCFKSKQDSNSFVSAMKFIKHVLDEQHVSFEKET